MAAPSPGPREVLAPSPEAGRRVATSSSSRGGLLWRLRDKQPRLGLFEIGPGHELHRLTCMMQAGLWAATQVSIDHPLLGFELGTLAGPAFAWLRHSLGLAEKDYQASLGPGGPYLQFLSTSKSKASFFLSHDQRFFLKTQRRKEVRALLAHLPRYMQHLRRHPHSLLARLLGVHSLRVARGKKVGEAEAKRPGRRGQLQDEILSSLTPYPCPQKYFIIMQSVFYPASRISERYDIKGCEVSRWVDPAPEGSPLILVLKDLNFQGKTIYLGLCKGYRARMSREPRTAGCCQKSPTPFTSWTDPNNATSWASWTLPLSTGSASGWSTCGRRCVTLAGPSPPSAQLATPVASTSGWRRTPSDQRRPASFPFGQWAHAESGFKPGRGRGSGSHCLLFLLLASRGQHSPANTRTTQPHLMVMLCRALCQGLPTLAHLMLKKCYYSLFTDHEMEAEGVKGLSKILQQ
ncbi:phosphatidylinositol 4-phosphate 5-kinase-like protein 1 isoform X2 [Rhinolophus ferrumequinum]|uniref:phosphatidylinositol 4-phosphate 5-kinase-like protein 1 isoform X2 n=1 Tax=Rhinolophus ferrumequinum TaxID=59479 RepID=UPI00140F6FE3|nr:phosphatidylinositol 4-phosphate 5-kinase-like protein 1 isoform X2 [Rhinolophus ferrumequinum]